MKNILIPTFLALGLCLSPASADPLIGKVGVYSFPDSVWWDQWMEFQSNIEAEPDQFEFEWYMLGELGSEQQLITGARRNRIQIISISTQGMTSLVPEIGALLAPYIFDSLEEADFVLDNYLAKPIGVLFSDLGLEILQFTEVGWSVLYTVDKPVLEPQDLHGMTIRISPSIILQSFVESIGSDYAILELGALIPGLQTGLVHGGLTNVVFVHNALAGQVCCVTRLRGMYKMGVNFANAQWLNSATPEQVTTLKSAYVDIATMRRSVRDYVEEVVNEGEARGLTYFDLTPAQRDRWKQASSTGLQRILDDTGAEGARLYQLLLDGKAAYARQTGE